MDGQFKFQQPLGMEMDTVWEYSGCRNVPEIVTTTAFADKKGLGRRKVLLSKCEVSLVYLCAVFNLYFSHTRGTCRHMRTVSIFGIQLGATDIPIDWRICCKRIAKHGL